jgi:putative endonuclease
MTTKDIGNLGELLACKFLKKKRYKILENNLHVSHNELDIVALDKKQGFIVFVEVKTRSVERDLYSPFGRPADAVTRSKQKRTVDAARGFLHTNPKMNKYQPRFDVIEVYLDKENRALLEINHIENAFGV